MSRRCRPSAQSRQARFARAPGQDRQRVHRCRSSSHRNGRQSERASLYIRLLSRCDLVCAKPATSSPSCRRHISRRRSGQRSRCGRLLVLEALTAKHGPPLRRLEGNGGLHAALRALGASLGPRRPAAAGLPPGRTAARCPLELAGLASLGVVLELLVEEEKLFAGGEDELTATVCAG